jgi:hypothetical protein
MQCLRLSGCNLINDKKIPTLPTQDVHTYLHSNYVPCTNLRMYKYLPTSYVQIPTYLPHMYVCTYTYRPASYVQVTTYLVRTNTYTPTLYVRTYIHVPTYLVRTYTYLPLKSWGKHRVLRKWAMRERINQKIY